MISLTDVLSARLAGMTKFSPLRAGGFASGLYANCAVVAAKRNDKLSGVTYEVTFSIEGREMASEPIEIPSDPNNQFFDMNMGKVLRLFSAIIVSAPQDPLTTLADALAIADYAKNFDSIEAVFQALGGNVPGTASLLVQDGHAYLSNRSGKWAKKSIIVEVLTPAETEALQTRIAAGETVIEDCPDYAAKTAKLSSAERSATAQGGAPQLGSVGAPSAPSAPSAPAAPAIGAPAIGAPPQI